MIEELRGQLDELDGKLLKLVSERLEVVAQIKAEKQKSGRHLFDRGREQEVLRLAEERGAALGLSADVTRAVMQTLLEASHALQEAPPSQTAADEHKHILIVGGRGRMGTMLGAALSARGHRISVLEQDDAVEGVSEADIVMVAVPMTRASEVTRKLAPLIRSDALLCDINSLKVDVCSALEASAGEALGTHPMFGPTVGSLRRQKVVLCNVKPGPMTSWLTTELGRMGAEIIVTTPEQHDAMMAVVQVLTHFGIMAMGRALSRSGHALRESLPFTSPIYRLELAMVGRLFSQKPELYREIMMQNPAGPALRKLFLEEASVLCDVIDRGDADAFVASFEEVHRYFASFSDEAMPSERPHHRIHHEPAVVCSMAVSEEEYANRCGSCAAFARARPDASLGRVGDCLLDVYPPPVRATDTCSRYRPKGATGAAPRPRAAGEPRRYRSGATQTPTARRTRVDEPVVMRRELPKEIDIDMDIDEFRSVLREVIADELGVSRVSLGRRWEGGELVLKPGNDETQEKRVPIESFFHKIVMVRDKLRVLEAKVNSHKGLSDEEKVQMQSYVTACYGSLTTFNVLFADKDDQFSTKR